jgi:DNA-directed RNA polymerase subunit beta'
VKVHDRIRFKNPDLGKQTSMATRLAKVIETTAGRVIFNQIWPKAWASSTRPAARSRSPTSSSAPTRRRDTRDGRDARPSEGHGLHWATKAGISIGITDMIIPTEKQVELDSAYKQIAEVDKQYRRGIITMVSAYNKIIDIWTHAGEEIANVMFRTLEHNEGRKELNPVFPHGRFRGARGNRQQVKQFGRYAGV